jgi:hypothetical protein
VYTNTYYKYTNTINYTHNGPMAADGDGHVVALHYCRVVLLLLLWWWWWSCVIVALLSWSHCVAWSSSAVVLCHRCPSSCRVVRCHAHSAVVHCNIAVSSHHPLEWQRGRAGLPLPFPLHILRGRVTQSQLCVLHRQ